MPSHFSGKENVVKAINRIWAEPLLCPNLYTTLNYGGDVPSSPHEDPCISTPAGILSGPAMGSQGDIYFFDEFEDDFGENKEWVALTLTFFFDVHN